MTTLAEKTYRVEKRVANTDHWGIVAGGYPLSREAAIEMAKQVVGGEATGVRICDTSSPYNEPELIVGE